MSIIHEVATMTAKGQITLPKPIRQALAVDVGSKAAFELHGNGRVVVSRADAEHGDPDIGAFLDLLARGNPPENWASLMTASRHDWPAGK